MDIDVKVGDKYKHPAYEKLWTVYAVDERVSKQFVDGEIKEGYTIHFDMNVLNKQVINVRSVDGKDTSCLAVHSAHLRKLEKID